ncbi:methyltransferase domain-containing protein [Paenibacillus campinasensis]|uniref:Methyltransferase domain-containing protein n=1 Tax=Paenibacillus campinasensis TaxID=66347 RepID=A0ABW9T6P7_9BACL|nr:methyltransferase domain-containing protein [Paenibacillus campinasensis]MUG69008.1 methyltransferase domain-containing protein [Paenibacillus campinasensis]
MLNNIFDELNWEKAWREDEETGVNMMKAAGVVPERAFDKTAQKYNDQCFSEEGKQRTERIIGWLEEQGIVFERNSVLDIGAASGGFSIPFAQRGAQVTAVEPNLPFAEILEDNNQKWTEGKVRIVKNVFEEIDIQKEGWEKAFDLVFVSMCPTIADWESVEKVLSCARKFCYISVSAGPREHSLTNEILPYLKHPYKKPHNSEMIYLIQLLYLKGYAFHSLVTKEMKTMEISREAAIREVLNWLNIYQYPVDSETRDVIESYLDQKYASQPITIHSGGRFGKVLVKLEDPSMYYAKK